jgi:transposase
MFYIRTVKTASNATAVQVISYQNRKRIVEKHIGSAHNAEEVLSLKQTAQKWIDQRTKQISLFPSERKVKLTLVPKEKLRNLGFRYAFAYETISKLFGLFQFSGLDNQLLLDLVLMRIIQPASKVESLKLLSEHFGIEHKRADLYRSIGAIISLKGTVEKKNIAFAKKHFSFDFSIVFYDVTTLYFETFNQDEDKEKEKGLRKKGFSKDNKATQPQIVIGLIVTREGFPVSYDIFEGNTFEGKTFIPTIIKFNKEYEVENLTVVADAAMLSLSNVQSLLVNNLSYIVGARVGNLKLEQIKEISKELSGVDGRSIRIETERGLLLCDYSLKRYQKDKREMENQIQRASYLINQPSKNKKSKFLKSIGKNSYVLNTKLIEKTKLLLGIRGYYTNLIEHANESIIAQYHNLWHVEQVFRVAKSDLAMRPIHHFKRQTIEAHILICFMALAVCKYMELQTGKSTKAIIKLLKGVTDARLLNTLTNEEIIIRSELSIETRELLNKLSLSH